MQSHEVIEKLFAGPAFAPSRHRHALDKLEIPTGPLAHAHACGCTTTGIEVHDHDVRNFTTEYSMVLK